MYKKHHTHLFYDKNIITLKGNWISYNRFITDNMCLKVYPWRNIIEKDHLPLKCYIQIDINHTIKNVVLI